jgi:hypothetical protein
MIQSRRVFLQRVAAVLAASYARPEYSYWEAVADADPISIQPPPDFELGLPFPLVGEGLEVRGKQAPSAPSCTSLEAPKVAERTGWGARSPTGDYRYQQPNLVTVHHAAGLWWGGDAREYVRWIQAFHQGPELGWTDIAYHYLVDRDGAIYAGRPEAAVPDTATNYDPAGHLALCLLGDFEVQQPTAEQIRSLVILASWLLAKHRLPLSALGGHRDYASTLCPGLHLYALLQDNSLTSRIATALTKQCASDVT